MSIYTSTIYDYLVRKQMIGKPRTKQKLLEALEECATLPQVSMPLAIECLLDFINNDDIKQVFYDIADKSSE